MTTRRWLLLVVLGMLGSCNYFFLEGLRADLYHGIVIDSQSNTQLPDAVVTVIWYTTPLISFERPRFFHNAQETVTAQDGKFSLRVSPGLDWNPGTRRLKEPTIIVYCPGYEPLWAATMINAGFSSPEAVLSAFKNGVTIKLRQLPNTKKDLQEYADAALFINRDVPSEQIRKLIEAINVHRKRIGFTPYSVNSEKGDGS